MPTTLVREQSFYFFPSCSSSRNIKSQRNSMYFFKWWHPGFYTGLTSQNLKSPDGKRVYCVLLFPRSALVLSVKAPEAEYIPPVTVKKSLCASQAKMQTFHFLLHSYSTARLAGRENIPKYDNAVPKKKQNIITHTEITLSWKHADFSSRRKRRRPLPSPLRLC